MKPWPPERTGRRDTASSVAHVAPLRALPASLSRTRPSRSEGEASLFSSLLETQVVEHARALAPVLPHLDHQVQVHPLAQQPLDVATGLDAHLLDHGATLAEYDGALAVPAPIHRGPDVEQVALLAWLHFEHLHRYRVRDLLLRRGDELLADELRHECLLGLVGDGVRREVARPSGRSAASRSTSGPTPVPSRALTGTTTAPGTRLSASAARVSFRPSSSRSILFSATTTGVVASAKTRLMKRSPAPTRSPASKTNNTASTSEMVASTSSCIRRVSTSIGFWKPGMSTRISW